MEMVKMECLSPSMSSCSSPHSMSLTGCESSLVTSDYGSEGAESDGMCDSLSPPLVAYLHSFPALALAVDDIHQPGPFFLWTGWMGEVVIAQLTRERNRP